MPGRRPRRERAWLILAGLALALAIVWPWTALASHSKDGLTHLEGRVVETWIQYGEDRFDYESRILVVVDGENVRFASNHGTSKTAVGDPVDVWYDPAKPGEDTFVTDEDLRGAVILPIFAAGLIVLFVIPTLLYQWWHSRRIWSPR